MYEVRNKNNDLIVRLSSLGQAKAYADELAKVDAEFDFGHRPYSVYEIKQVWTTQTLDEAMKEG